ESKLLRRLFDENVASENEIIKTALAAAETAQGKLAARFGWRYFLCWVLGLASGMSALATVQHFASLRYESNRDLFPNVVLLLLGSTFAVMFFALVFYGTADKTIVLTPNRDFEYLKNWRVKLMRTQQFLERDEPFILWLRDFNKVTEEQNVRTWSDPVTITS